MRGLNARSMVALTASNTSFDMFATEGASDTPYRISNLRVAYTPIQAGISVGSWRSVGHSFTGFVMEGIMDELAHAAKQDPYAFRAAHLAEGSRERRVLDAVAKLAGWGSPVPAGRARGIARHTAFGTEAAEVAEIAIEGGRIRVLRVWAAVDCGIAINPDLVKAQIEGGIIFRLSAALDQEITMIDGVVQQTNFDAFPPLRMHECPAIEVAVLPSTAAPTGVGEVGLPPIGPAVANAVFALTGVRLRRMPLQPALAEVKR
jgi:CO/xanthine dehydrogenase Mo-binding subunit